jgi:hypothetical protein
MEVEARPKRSSLSEEQRQEFLRLTRRTIRVVEAVTADVERGWRRVSDTQRVQESPDFSDVEREFFGKGGG